MNTTTNTSPPGRSSATASPERAPASRGPRADWAAAAAALRLRLAESAALADARGSFAAESFELVRAGGFTTMLVPGDLGGPGLSFGESCAVLAELARGCPATALTLSMHSHLVAAQVWRHRRGMPAPVLARVLDGAVLVSTGASDWFDSNGAGTAVDGGYRVTARKQPASGASAGDVVVTSFRTVGPTGPQVVHAAIPLTATGVSVEPTWDAVGMRATGSDTVVLDDVFVPDAAVSLVRDPGWHPVWATVLGVALPLIMSVYVGGDHAVDVLTRKTNAAAAVVGVARTALEVGGGRAYARCGGIERLFRDLHGSLYHPLPAPVQERFCGRHALGLDPYAGMSPG